ncbi:MAG: serine hydrolase [Lachnospiraceae bacterium]|nr:serine hydrolase [Lachnospiraceae bacterium]
MKNKITAIFLIIVMTISLCPVSVSAGQSYEQHFENSEEKMFSRYYGTSLDGLGEHAAVLKEEDDQSFKGDVQSALLVDASNNQVLASQNALGKAYPASTTKVLTALLTLENCNLTDTVTIKENITFDEGGVVAVGLKKGDKVKVEGLLNALLIESANDCAIALAEHIAGSTEKFADMMNQRAKELGATHCNFVTTNGLHDKDHYVTAYDLYLIFKEAVQYDAFLNIIGKANYTLDYETAAGIPMSIPMETTNHYILGDYNLPDDIFMIGGKTGTTSEAGSCLIILTQNSKGNQYISVILNAETKDILYRTMSELLEKTHK